MNAATTCLTLAALLTVGCAHRPWERALAGQGSLVVQPGEGVGNVRLGMGKARVARRLGEPGAVDVFADGESYWTYPQLGLSAKFEGRKLDALFCYSGVKGGYETRAYVPFPGATPEGVTVHSSEREVLEIYGRPANREQDPDAPIPASWLTYHGLGFCFADDSDRMVYLYVD